MLRGRRTVSGSALSPVARRNSGDVASDAQLPQRRMPGIGRPGTAAPGRNQRSKAVDTGIVVLLALAFLLTLATYMLPDIRKAEEEELHKIMMGGHQQPPLIKTSEEEALNSQPLIKVDEMSTKWVDGEKKLKKRLEILSQRQASGQDIGVPVLTRWLGDDIPAWPTDPDNHMDEAEWKKIVAERYEEMRKEEMEWRSQMTHFLDQERG